jgi:DNA-binding transcriptional ArsR family regulator
MISPAQSVQRPGCLLGSVNLEEPMGAELDATLAALADPTRRHVVDLLRERPRRAGELAAACAMSGPAMSRHLRVLRAGGLVEVEGEPVEEDARLRVYRLRPEPFVGLQAWLDQVQAFWSERLGSYKAHVERAQKGENL